MAFVLNPEKHKILKIKKNFFLKFNYKKLFAVNFNCSISFNYHIDDIYQAVALDIIYECFLFVKVSLFSFNFDVR